MKLYYIDKNYLEYIYENVDDNVLFSHTEVAGRGRANVLVVTLKYRGINQYFAVPEKGEIDVRRITSENFVGINSSKIGGKFSSGFVVSQMMPIDVGLITPFNLNDSLNFRQIATEITRKEPELIAKTRAHLKRLEMFAPSRFSTNVDKQLQFLRAYVKLRRAGVSEREIYSRSFNDNLNIARRL